MAGWNLIIHPKQVYPIPHNVHNPHPFRIFIAKTFVGERYLETTEYKNCKLHHPRTLHMAMIDLAIVHCVKKAQLAGNSRFYRTLLLQCADSE